VPMKRDPALRELRWRRNSVSYGATAFFIDKGGKS
jgi:hypothetical protein